MTNWEYKTIVMDQKSSFWSPNKSDFLNGEIIEMKLNIMGQSGWELVSSTPNCELFGLTTKVLLIFKRAKP
jgi:Domain of unknown function (DUF4177)